MTDYCLYHANCLDGITAAAAVHLSMSDSLVYIPVSYQEDPPFLDEDELDTIYIVDFSYKRDVLLKLAEKAKAIIILDHHKSAQEDLRDISQDAVNIECVFDMERSGARLAWDYFHGDTDAPWIIKNVEDRDLWRFNFSDTRAITAALYTYDFDLPYWTQWFGYKVAPEWLMTEGEALLRKQNKDVKGIINTIVRRTIIDGHDVPIVNALWMYSSDLLNELCKDEPFAVCYWDTPSGRTFSLRSNKEGLDVSKIATKYGGGGHARAAGFKLKLGHLSVDTLAQIALNQRK